MPLPVLPLAVKPWMFPPYDTVFIGYPIWWGNDAADHQYFPGHV